jgi:hypothetical protein
MSELNSPSQAPLAHRPAAALAPATLPQVEARLAKLRAEEGKRPCAGPGIVMGLGSGLVLASLGTSLVYWLGSFRFEEDDSEPDFWLDDDGQHRARIALAISLVGLGVATVGALWAARVNRKLRERASEIDGLESRRRALKADLVPTLGPTGLGLTLRGVF